MFGYKTLASLNRALFEAGLSRLQLTEDEWTFGIDSRRAYTFAYLNVEAALQASKKEQKARELAKANRPRLTAAHYHF